MKLANALCRYLELASVVDVADVADVADVTKIDEPQTQLKLPL